MENEKEIPINKTAEVTPVPRGGVVEGVGGEVHHEEDDAADVLAQIGIHQAPPVDPIQFGQPGQDSSLVQKKGPWERIKSLFSGERHNSRYVGSEHEKRVGEKSAHNTPTVTDENVSQVEPSQMPSQQKTVPGTQANTEIPVK